MLYVVVRSRQFCSEFELLVVGVEFQRTNPSWIWMETNVWLVSSCRKPKKESTAQQNPIILPRYQPNSYHIH